MPAAIAAAVAPFKQVPAPQHEIAVFLIVVYSFDGGRIHWYFSSEIVFTFSVRNVLNILLGETGYLALQAIGAKAVSFSS